MIKHIVLWKLDDSYSKTEKEMHIHNMQKELLGLKGKITALKAISVYTNDKRAAENNYDLILDTEFDSLDDLNTYQVHPDHQAVVESIGPIKKNRAAIDFEI
ncbi:MAG: Dabb family protein [Bacteroidetes bacterium]|jgi:hypothetical protein|nr:Dabb family protein [Bacteroidota bacterium]